MTYRVTRKRLDAALASLDLGRHCYFLPVEGSGRVVGVKVYGMKPDSLPALAGLRNGDMISEINGIPPNTADAALRIRDQFYRSNRFTIKLERGGQTLTLVATVR